MAQTDRGDGAEQVDLVVVGAGIAGLNALFVAAQYLPASARVVLVDRNAAPGGMWTCTYPHVRLHQPYRMFTVGDLDWALDRPPGYLATGAEVQAHLADCLERLSSAFRLERLFGHDCTGIEEVPTPGGTIARVRVAGAAGERLFEAPRVIRASGWDVPVARPLAMSSRQIVSTTPERLEGDDRDPAAPVVIVGGGKTGMDTAHMLIRRFPGRRVTMLNGRGTIFAYRDVMFPEGHARWWRGVMIGAVTRDITGRFDGGNPVAVFERFRQRYGLSPDGHGAQYLFATMGRDEAREIAGGLTAIRNGYLSDVVDGPQGPEMVLRDGQREPVPPGTVFVNCTGQMLRHDRPYEPFLSPGGAVLTVTLRSAVYALSGTAAYFLSHVFFLDKLRALPLYELDMDRLFNTSRVLFFSVCLTHSFYNMLVIMQNVPLKVFARCGLDLNRWYPLPRRLLSFARLRLAQRRLIAQCRASLDRVRQETGIRCGPLPDPAIDAGHDAADLNRQG